MIVYQNLGINSEGTLGLPADTRRIPFVISSARLIPNSYAGRTALQMELQEKGGNLAFGYGLIGREIFVSFLDALSVKKPKDLVGKVVMGLISPSDDVAKGLLVNPRV